MVKKFQTLCLMDSASPRHIVTLQVKDIKQKGKNYRVIVDESPRGKFTFNTEEGCIFAKSSPCNKAEFVCVGRYNC